MLNLQGGHFHPSSLTLEATKNLTSVHRGTWLASGWSELGLRSFQLRSLHLPHNAADGEPCGCLEPESLTGRPWATPLILIHSLPLLYLPPSSVESSPGQQKSPSGNPSFYSYVKSDIEIHLNYKQTHRPAHGGQTGNAPNSRSGEGKVSTSVWH